jgi:hypothetical protein
MVVVELNLSTIVSDNSGKSSSMSEALTMIRKDCRYFSPLSSAISMLSCHQQVSLLLSVTLSQAR